MFEAHAPYEHRDELVVIKREVRRHLTDRHCADQVYMHISALGKGHFAKGYLSQIYVPAFIVPFNDAAARNAVPNALTRFCTEWPLHWSATAICT